MDPITKRRTERWSGAAMNDAVTDTERTAQAFDRTPRTIQRWKDGKHPSWLTESLGHLQRVHESGGSTWRLVTHVQAFGKYLTIRSEPTADLVERWHSLSEIEHDYEARQNRHHANGECPDSEALADEQHAAVLLERAAVRRELDERRVNPRDYGSEA